MKKTSWYAVVTAIILISVGVYAIFDVDTKDQKGNKQTPISNTSSIHEKDVKKNEVKTEKAPLKSKVKYNIAHEKLRSSYIAPSFITEKVIAFEYDVSLEKKSYIGVMTRGEKNFKNIYTAPNEKIINSLVGIKETLYWIEYDRVRKQILSWELKSIDLTSKNVQTIEKGISEDELDPPVLRTDNNKVSYITKVVRDHVVISSLVLYDPIQRKKSVIAESHLNEQGNTRSGVFMIIQRPVTEGVLVQQTVFNPNKSNKENKVYQIIYYPVDKTKQPLVMKEGTGIIDFTLNEDWFIWTEIGKLYAADRKTGEIKHIIEAKDKELTLDSPFIFDDTLYYRYSMYQILSLNLRSGKVHEYSPQSLTTSKLFNSDGYLGFSIMDPIKNNGQAEISIIQTNK